MNAVIKSNYRNITLNININVLSVWNLNNWQKKYNLCYLYALNCIVLNPYTLQPFSELGVFLLRVCDAAKY